VDEPWHGPPVAVVGSEARTGFVPPENGFLLGSASRNHSVGGKGILFERKGDLKVQLKRR